MEFQVGNHMRGTTALQGSLLFQIKKVKTEMFFCFFLNSIKKHLFFPFGYYETDSDVVEEQDPTSFPICSL